MTERVAWRLPGDATYRHGVLVASVDKAADGKPRRFVIEDGDTHPVSLHPSELTYQPDE